MDREKLAQRFKKTVQGTSESLKSAAKDVHVPESIKSVMKDVKVPDQLTGALGKFKKNGEEAENLYDGTAISVQDALKVFYYLMSVDGEIADTEEEKFAQIGAALDQRFEDHRLLVIHECKQQMEKLIDPDDYYDVIQSGVEKALSAQTEACEEVIPPKLLLWDMMTIAYSDNQYGDAERRLLKYVIRKLEIEKDVFLEMENSLLTIRDLDQELGWIKTTTRPYLTIDTMVKELENRKNAVFDGVKDLIVL